MRDIKRIIRNWMVAITCGYRYLENVENGWVPYTVRWRKGKVVVNCDNPKDPDHQLICPKLSNPSAICKKCEAWQEADCFVRRWFKGGMLVDFWHTWQPLRIQLRSGFQRCRIMISRHFEHVARSIKPKEAAPIHATVLSILISVFSAYSIFIYGEIRTKRQDVISKAQEINQIYFIRSAYIPRDKDVFMATGPQDRERIRASLVELSILTSMAKKWNDLKIPEDPAERAERFLEKLNIFSHRYPFPKAVEKHSNGFGQFPPETISFSDIETLREWLNVLTSITNTNALMFLPPYDLGMFDKYLNALAIRDKVKIQQSESGPFLQATGERDPYKIVNDFIKNIDRVVDIRASTSLALERADKLKASLIPKTWTITILVIGVLVFITSVFLPLVSSRLHPFWYIHFPFFYFIVMYSLVVVKIIFF